VFRCHATIGQTEKRFEPSVGYVDFRLDIFAETTDRRIVIEIQRVEYDSATARHNFDRFLHYFLIVIAEHRADVRQKSAKLYGTEQTVYVIVVLTAPYTIEEKTGKAVLDEVLLLTLNPRTLSGQVRDLYGHQLVFLNPNHPADDTPPGIRDWLTLIHESIHNPQHPVVNEANEGIQRAVSLIDFDNLTPEERAEAKNRESARVTRVKYEEKAREEGREEGKAARNYEIARLLKSMGEPIAKISLLTGLSDHDINRL